MSVKPSKELYKAFIINDAYGKPKRAVGEVNFEGVITSSIVRIDLVNNIIETKNTLYQVMSWNDV